MSRRDTIIIAVLVNAALLTVLFITAVRTRNNPGKEQTEVLAPEFVKEEKRAPLQQEDLLNQYIADIPILSEEICEVPSPDQNVTELVGVEGKTETTSAIATGSSEIAIQETPKIETTQSEYVNVTVKKGDFLEKIAKANKTTVQAIMKANSLSSTQLKIGQVLRVPNGTRGIEKPLTPSAESEYYIVKDGDNPWLIASRNHLKLHELLKLNNLDEQKAKKLRPGDRLRIR